jgi:DNA-binding LacI/PurR family transcriptional regulator
MLKMSDIATHAGVSPTTVSFVLNDRHETLRISEKTRLKVLKAAEELGYRSNHLARAMRTGNTRMLGILGGNAEEEQVGRMLSGALKAADDQGYTLKILRLEAFGGSAQQVIRRISELRLMGMLALHLPDSVLEELSVEAHKCETPLVLMDARCKDAGMVQVISDDAGGIRAGVEHLVRLGHSKIAFVRGGGESQCSVSVSRQEAFEAAMAGYGLAVPPEYIADGHFRLREVSVEAARALLNLPLERRPTAILCAGDLIALATLQVAHELELNLPRDLSIVGFANMISAEFSTPPLTTVEQPFNDMGRVAVNTLLSFINERMKNGHEETESVTLIELPALDGCAEADGNVKILPTRLIERASTAPPRTR